MNTTLEGQTVWVTQEPTLAEVTSGNYVLPVNFKVVDATNNTYKMVSYVFDSVNGARRLESGGGDYIPRTGTVKNISGNLGFDKDKLQLISETVNTSDVVLNSGAINVTSQKEGDYEQAISGVQFQTNNVKIDNTYTVSSVSSLATNDALLKLSSTIVKDATNPSQQSYQVEIFANDNETTKFSGLKAHHLTEESALTEGHFVQKAYVDKTNSYSLDETKTGGTWIDGRPIYRKVIKQTVKIDEADKLGVLSSNITDAGDLINFGGNISYYNEMFLLTTQFASGLEVGPTISTRVFNNAGAISLEIGANDGNYAGEYLLVSAFFEYTKTTDTSSLPNPE